jgi:hypothetical protein
MDALYQISSMSPHYGTIALSLAVWFKSLNVNVLTKQELIAHQDRNRDEEILSKIRSVLSRRKQQLLSWIHNGFVSNHDAIGNLTSKASIPCAITGLASCDVSTELLARVKNV